MTTVSIFSDYGSDLTKLLREEADGTSSNPLKDHAQIPFVIDTLCRHERHHVALVSSFSNKIHYELVRAVTHHILDENVPGSLRNCRVIYFDAIRFNKTSYTKEKIIHDIQTLTSQLKHEHQRIIFAINQVHFSEKEDTLSFLIKQVLMQDTWRVILFTPEQNALNVSQIFSVSHLIEPDANEFIALLKAYRIPLENFHRVSISDEVITNAFTMAAQYLPGPCRFEKTLELLDSAAARASMLDRHEHTEHKTVLTPHFLAQVISNSTRISIAHLNNHKFQSARFIENVKKNIFGQDAAISMIASILQNACLQLQDNTGPLCNFLLVGPSDTGKTEIAYAITKHLLGSHNALLRVNLNQSCTSITDIKITPGSGTSSETNLLAAIQKMPYAIVLIEDLEMASEKMRDLLHEIVDSGYVLDDEKNKYDFRHAIVIATTRIAGNKINELTGSSHPHENQTKAPDLMQLDLMQLVMNKNLHDSPEHHPSCPSPDELCDQLIPELMHHFPKKLLQKFNIIPLASLDYAALEHIIRSRIKLLARRLLGSFNIELNFAPEVIKFLAHEALWRKNTIKSLDKLLEQHLYSTVIHEILLHAEDTNRSKRLLIQLNDSGHLLRCEFIASNEALYNL